MNKNGAREEFLKARIKERGTMKEFAASIDMPYTTLWSILQNVGGAAIDNVIRICHGLGFPVSVLEGGAEEPPKNANDRLLERELLESYRRCKEPRRANIREYAEDQAARQEEDDIKEAQARFIKKKEIS